MVPFSDTIKNKLKIATGDLNQRDLNKAGIPTC